MAMVRSRTTCGIIVLIYYMVPLAAAQTEINWAAVGLSWLFSLITSVIIVAVAVLLLSKKITKQQKQSDLEGLERPQYRRELSMQSEASDMTRISVQSGQPLYNNSGYKRVPIRESNTNRRKSDFISSWCSKHGLTEIIAANLRENGFTSREQVDSLLPSDVMTLGLPNLAQQVQLRNVLEHLQTSRGSTTTRDTVEIDRREDRESHGVRSSAGSHNRARSGSNDRNRTRSSTTDESNAASPAQVSPASTSHPASGAFNYSRSMGQLTEQVPITIIPTAIPSSHTNHSRLSFHGLLSDTGLYELAECLGTEWRHLSAILGVPKAQQEHLLHDYPGNTKQQIYEMLRSWREYIARGEKEQVKAQLAESLTKIKRKDLADKILREQVHGSDPNLRGAFRMNSVV